MQWLKDLLVRRTARCFLAGVFAILPVVLTVAVVVWVADLLRQFVGPKTTIGAAIRSLGMPFVENDIVAYLLGAVLVLVGVFALGVLVESGAKNLLQRLFDGLLHRIPLIGTVYGTSQKMVAMLDKKGDADLKGMKTVFIFFGQEKSVGVLALLVSPERYHVAGGEYQIVIIPTAPVPIGGGLFFVPVERVQPTDLSVDALMSIYVSMGVTAPQFLPPK